MPLRALEGFTVAVTADRRASEQADLLARRGAEVVRAPTISTEYLGEDRPLHEATTALVERPPDVVVVNTGVGMRAWFEAAQLWGLGDALLAALAPAAVFARGPKAEAAATRAGLSVAGRAETERLDEVEALVADRVGPGVRVAIQLHGEPDLAMAARMRAGGADVVTVPVYRWRLPADTGPAERLVDAVVDRRVDAVTFTSAPAVRNLLGIAGPRADALRAAFAADVVAACVGPVCAEVAVELGIERPVAPSVGRLGLLLRVLTDELSRRRRVLETAAGPIVVQGAAVELPGGDVVLLPRRERAVLDALASRQGAVVGLESLARAAWPGGGGTRAAVQVTLARLRRRLGPAGEALVTVPRRGYRLA